MFLLSANAINETKGESLYSLSPFCCCYVPLPFPILLSALPYLI